MTLLIGYGNPGRGDDGLGPAFAEAVARAGLPGLEVRVAYQLVAEHALAVAECRHVIFADARIGGRAPFRLTPASADETGDIASHALSPQTVLALARNLMGKSPPAHVMAITGVRFDRIEEGLSAQATANLAAAVSFFADWATSHLPGPDQTRSVGTPARNAHHA